MTKQNAILFNGAASLIAQEVGMLDLLMEIKGLTINQDNTFIAGLSSGALMTAATNAAFSDNPPLSWSTFKEDILFPLTTADVYKSKVPPFDTTPLRNLLTQVVTDRAGYNVLGDLPFPCAVLIYSYWTASTYWLNNVTDSMPSGISIIASELRKNNLNLDLVDSLMCSTAIPVVFPSQNLRYQDGQEQKYIRSLLDKKAPFLDGGTAGVFRGLKDFFNAYGETFENLYFITPNIVPVSGKSQAQLFGNSILGLDHAEAVLNYFSTLAANSSLEALKAFSIPSGLAKNVYLSKPDIKLFNPLDFSTQKEQYDRPWPGAEPTRTKSPSVLS